MMPNSVQVVLPLASVVLVLFLLQGIASAEAQTHPYMGNHIQGYSSSVVSGRSWDPVTTINGYTEFDGTTAGSLNPDLLSMVSTAGWIKNSNTVSGVQYQFPIQMRNNGLIYSDPQVHKLDTPIWGCFAPVNSFVCPVMGSNSQVDYVFYAMYWYSPTSVIFYAETHFEDDHIEIDQLVYTRNTSVDPSDAFSTGLAINPNSYGDKIYQAKLLQVGVESDNPGTNWNVRQWGIGYFVYNGGQRYLVNDNVFVSHGGLSDQDTNFDLGKGSDITWNPSTNVPVNIGESIYAVNADYDNKAGSSKPPGDVTWFRGTTLPYATGLWGQRAVIVTDQSLGTVNNVGGMYTVVKDSSNNVIRSGFTPLSVIIPSSGSYKIDHTNYGNLYYTKSVATPSTIVTDLNVFSWGGQSIFSLPSVKAYTVDGQYYNHGVSDGFARLTVNSQVGSNGLSGMFVALNIPGNSNPLYTKGYTSFTVGVPDPGNNVLGCCDVTWTNWGAYYYQNANIAPNVETAVTKYSWGGVQHIMPDEGVIYIDTANYNQCGSPC